MLLLRLDVLDPDFVLVHGVSHFMVLDVGVLCTLAAESAGDFFYAPPRYP